jgi:hypothetical protein
MQITLQMRTQFTLIHQNFHVHCYISSLNSNQDTRICWVHSQHHRCLLYKTTLPLMWCNKEVLLCANILCLPSVDLTKEEHQPPVPFHFILCITLPSVTSFPVPNVLMAQTVVLRFSLLVDMNGLLCLSSKLS